MKNNVLFFPREIYQRYLSVIEGIYFTRREVDIMACLLYARNTGKIAFLLDIASTTVTTHIKNIMEKLKCHSRESIIDFVENAHHVDIIKKYYVSLIIHSTFKRSLKAFSKIINKPALLPLIVYCKNPQAQDILFFYLPIHLKLAGIEAEIQSRKLESFDDQIKKDVKPQEGSHKIQSANKVLIIILKQEDKDRKKLLRIPDMYRLSSTLIDFNDQKGYCLTVFEVLKKLYPKAHFETAISQFTKTCEALERPYKALPAELALNTSFQEKGGNGGTACRERQYRRLKYWKTYGKRTSRRIIAFFHQVVSSFKKSAIVAYGFAFLLFGLGGFLFLYKGQNNKQPQVPQILAETPICSDLEIPKEPVLLLRPDLIAQIEDKFRLSKNTQVVALIGPGGSGKTTLARYYARSQRSPIVWELNAESRESLKASYEELAKALAKNEIDKNELRAVYEIKNPKERETEIRLFIKEKLRVYSRWILIYDNFGKVAEIKDYFPKDFETWGIGQVLITTRNVQLRNNMYVDHVVPIGFLSPAEKQELFWKIIKKGGSEEENALIASPIVDVFQDEKGKSINANIDEKR
jgi:DNA-binding CsgD family transcriptional regulator